jgi:hypothetical protein
MSSKGNGGFQFVVRLDGGGWLGYSSDHHCLSFSLSFGFGCFGHEEY